MRDAIRPREADIEAFLAAAGWAGAVRRYLAGDASFRRYDRVLKDGRRAVLMDAPPEHEDTRPFVKVASLLRRLGLSAPEVLAADNDLGLVLVEDLGGDTYTRLLAAGADEHRLYALATDVLVELHRRFDAADELPRFDDARAEEEVERLIDWYWPAAMGEPIAAQPRAEYRHAWRQALTLGRRVPESIALFDYHVDNLLWLKDRPGVAACGLLDFQDAVMAPVAFDLMSLIEDARRDVPAALAQALVERYLAAFPQVDRGDFAQSFAVFGAQRHARILGTFARLLVRDGKPAYLKHVPRVWRQLEGALTHPALRPVRAWFDRHLPAGRRVVPAARAPR